METISLIVHLSSGTSIQTEFETNSSVDLEDEEVLGRVKQRLVEGGAWKNIGGLLVHAGAISAIELT